VQQLLRRTLDAAPLPVIGLLGGHEQSVEYACAIHPDTQQTEGDIDKVLSHWREEGIEFIAIYSSERPPLPGAPGKRFPDLPLVLLNTDTKGRIEASLLMRQSGPEGTESNTLSCPLEMQEDGGLYPSRDKS